MAWLMLLAVLALLLAAGHAGTGCAHSPVLHRGQPAVRRLAEYVELTNTTQLPVLREIDKDCKRLLVVFCAVKKADEAGTIHDTYLKVSVLSVLEKAPSLVRHINTFLAKVTAAGRQGFAGVSDS